MNMIKLLCLRARQTDTLLRNDAKTCFLKARIDLPAEVTSRRIRFDNR